MAITKTNFINYLRCPRYCALDDIKKNRLDSYITYDEYYQEELNSIKEEILESMYDEAGTDLIDITNEQLEVMLPYYNKVEQLAGSLAHNYFKGKFKYAKDTKMQESFDTLINGIRYICYVDIYNENDDEINIIEVKATTSKKYMELGPKINGITTPIITKGADGIYYFLNDLNLNIEDYMPEKKYQEKINKLYDKYTNVGHYVYDLAVQRYIIENDLKEHNINKKVNYYLAVLDHEYIFDGTYQNGVPKYEKDDNDHDIIRYIDMTSITKNYMDIIDKDRKKIEMYINNNNPDPTPLGIWCENKKSTTCKYKSICWNKIPETNSVFNYLDNHYGFKGLTTYDLTEKGMYAITDVPDDYLEREKNIIQKQACLTQKQYLKKDKIKAGIDSITYPIYHLDFESFPCPLPRFKGEKCYTQSVFQYSLHIESQPGICDKEKDHYGYLAKDHNDHRLDLVEQMIKDIDLSKGGTVLVYNESFEKSRLKELSIIFPQYQKELLNIREHVFDLMYVLRGNKKMYTNLGFDDDEASGINFYDYRMSGSYSIKKILPLFSNISYHDMEIANGVQAYIAYIQFPTLTPKDFAHRYQKLIEYCMQDTWSMVDILKGLRKLVNKV